MGQAVLDVGLHIAKLIPNVITIAGEFMGEDTLGLVQCVDGIGELNFVTLTRFLIFENIKDLWCQQVTANDGQVTWCIGNSWLFNKFLDVEESL